MSKTITFFFTAVSLFFVSLVCADAGDNSYSDKKISLNAGDKVVVFPFAFDYAEVEPELTKVRRELLDYMRSINLKPASINLTDDDSLRTIRLLVDARVSEEEKSNIRKDFALHIAGLTDYQLALFPSIVNREAKRKRHKVVWDGVSQTLEITGSIETLRSHDLIDGLAEVHPLDKSAEDADYNGLSLRLDALDAKGNWIFTTYGGLTVPYYFDNSEQKFLIKESLFENKKGQEYLREGVAIASDALANSMK